MKTTSVLSQTPGGQGGEGASQEGDYLRRNVFKDQFEQSQVREMGTHQKNKLDNRRDLVAGEGGSTWGEVVKMPEKKISFLWSFTYSPFMV